MATKPNGKSPVSSASDEKVNVLPRCLAGSTRNSAAGTVIQGFISPSRIEKYLGTMERGKVYKLDNFYGSCRYRVMLLVLDEVQIAAARHLLVATEFYKKFKSSETTPTVLLVTTVNTKRLGGTLALTSMSSSRVFMDYDVQPTIDYFGWLSSNPAIAEHVDAEVVTKRETMTIGELFSYIKQESSKEAFFECTATIDDVVHDYAWYYISCSGCHSKVTKGPTSLICTNNKCGKVNVDGVAQ
ncbi:hypothetical protein F2Q69_00040174 [Brassica cretica]|uniref:Replication factor A C-terminal domain-containing protein n=1 Tax=Brassica cretica TaxID=69181 RepID=A0A8S9NE35_BRACR|nr:hypothetical protein F2Q69_00040174 [Brassica cretica]